MRTCSTECRIKDGVCEREQQTQSHYPEPIAPVRGDERLLRVVKKVNIKNDSLDVNFLNTDQLLDSGWSFARSSMIESESHSNRISEIGGGIGAGGRNADDSKKIEGFVSVEAAFFRNALELPSVIEYAEEMNINLPSSQALCVIDDAIADYKEHALVLASDDICKIDEVRRKSKFFPNKALIKALRKELLREMWATMTYLKTE